MFFKNGGENRVGRYGVNPRIVGNAIAPFDEMVTSSGLGDNSLICAINNESGYINATVLTIVGRCFGVPYLSIPQSINTPHNWAVVRIPIVVPTGFETAEQ